MISLRKKPSLRHKVSRFFTQTNPLWGIPFYLFASAFLPVKIAEVTLIILAIQSFFCLREILNAESHKKGKVQSRAVNPTGKGG